MTRAQEVWTWIVDDFFSRTDQGLLDAFQKELGGPVSSVPTRSQIQRWIRDGRVQVNQKLLFKPSEKLQKGSVIQVQIPELEPLEWAPEERFLDILFEDEYLLVVNKPPLLTVHPSTSQKSGTLVHALLSKVTSLSSIGGRWRPGVVHRIDQNTSGALVIAKTNEAHLGLSRQFSEHSIERVYWALCYGAPSDSSLFRVESLIGRNHLDRKKMSMKVKNGRRAVTFYKKIKGFSVNQKFFASWLEVTLETGRTHQVRVHLTHEGYSLLGDPAYGLPTARQAKWLSLPSVVQAAVKDLPGQALHARVLGFLHPITQEKVRFECDPPPSFQGILDVLSNF